MPVKGRFGAKAILQCVKLRHQSSPVAPPPLFEFATPGLSVRGGGQWINKQKSKASIGVDIFLGDAGMQIFHLPPFAFGMRAENGQCGDDLDRCLSVVWCDDQCFPTLGVRAASACQAYFGFLIILANKRCVAVTIHINLGTAQG